MSHDTVVAQRLRSWLGSPVPKLFINGEPGALLTGAVACGFAARWPNQHEVTVAGVHFLPEDSPDEIGRALTAWLTSLD